MKQKSGTQKKGIKPKRVPKRICFVCREPAAKRSLVRFVRTEDGAEIDESGKKPGRGAYLCQQSTCWEAGLEMKRLDQALRRKFNDANYSELLAKMNSLIAEDDG